MRGLITYLDSAPSNNTNGFIYGTDGRMYWFSLMGITVKCGDIVKFQGEEDEKGYIAKRVVIPC